MHRITRRGAAVAALAALGLGGMGYATAETGLVGSDTPATSESSPAGSGAAGTGGNGDDNVAVAVNTRDGSRVYAVRLKIVQTDNATVDAGNAAVAAASCTDCRTVAIAIEGVLVYGDSTETVTPVNLALAINTECTNCETLAAAYQYLLSNASRVRITGAGRQVIAGLRQDLNTLRTRDLTLDEAWAEADRIAGAFYDVLKNEVVPIGRPTGTFPGPGAQVEEVPAEDASSPPSPTGSTSSTPSPAGSASASSTPSPSGSSSAGGTETPEAGETSTPTGSEQQASPSETPTSSP